jgi:Glycosyl transferase family 2
LAGFCDSWLNVGTGFNAASGDILMILDADLTTMPEELPFFLDVIASGQAEFVNGSRLIYPVPKGAMHGLNMLGNKFFSLTFSYLLGQRVKDTLCGTKVLWRTDWERIKPMLGSWGTEDRQKSKCCWNFGRTDWKARVSIGASWYNCSADSECGFFN